MRLFLALTLATLPTFALANGGPFTLPDLTYPEDPAPTAQGCSTSASLSTVCTQPAE